MLRRGPVATGPGTRGPSRARESAGDVVVPTLARERKRDGELLC
jgi:hypothetical protein